MKFTRSGLWASAAMIAASCLGFSGAARADDGMAHSILLQKASEAKFMAVPGVPVCTTMASLHGDLSKGPATVMVRMTSGCIVPFHWHTPSEELVVLQGAPLGQMMGQRPIMLKVGSYSQLPSHHVHRFRCTSKSDCLMFLVAGDKFDIHFVDEKGTEITTDAALVAVAKAGKEKW